MLKTQKWLRTSYLKASFLIAIALMGTACTSKDIHRNLEADSNVAVRQWTLQTSFDREAKELDAEFSNSVFYENTLVFGSRGAGLTSLYPGLLLVRWNLPIPNGIVSPIAVDGQSLYFGGGDGFLYSVNADTGRVNWRYDLHNPIISKPSIDQDRLYITTSDDTVFAFEAKTGKWLWHYRRRSSPSATILGASQPLIEGGEVITGFSDGYLVALSSQDGNLKWERKIHQGTKFTDVDAHPVLDADLLYVPSYDGALYALQRKDGSIVWRYDAGGVKEVQVAEDRIYLPSTDGYIHVLNKRTSQLIWKFQLDRGVPTEVVIAPQHLIFGSSQEFLYILDRQTGKPVYRWSVGWGSGFSSPPLFDEKKNRFYILSRGGNLYAWSLRTSQPSRDRGQTSGYIFSANTP